MAFLFSHGVNMYPFHYIYNLSNFCCMKTYFEFDVKLCDRLFLKEKVKIVRHHED